MSGFSERTIAAIADWHDVAPPNATALRMVADLQKVIDDVAALRGGLRFEDEPASFEAALLAAAAIEVSK
jgi:hypothetical protein